MNNLYFLPLFERFSNPHPVDVKRIINSIEEEVKFIVGIRCNSLPSTLDQYIIKEWEIKQAAIIQEHETRLEQVSVKLIINKKDEHKGKSTLGVCGFFQDMELYMEVEY